MPGQSPTPEPAERVRTPSNAFYYTPFVYVVRQTGAVSSRAAETKRNTKTDRCCTLWWIVLCCNFTGHGPGPTVERCRRSALFPRFVAGLHVLMLVLCSVSGSLWIVSWQNVVFLSDDNLVSPRLRLMGSRNYQETIIFCYTLIFR
jgi:hypothetical protein